MRAFKTILKYPLYLLYSFISGFFTPAMLIISFNYSHGIANNPDGTLLMPVGIAMVLSVLIIDLIIVFKTVKSNTISVLEKILVISLFVLVKILGMWLEPNGRRTFIECFLWNIRY